MVDIYKTIKLQGTKSGKISIVNISNPYGLGSDDVLSIGICLKDNLPEWQIHIPYDNLDELIDALKSIKR